MPASRRSWNLLLLVCLAVLSLRCTSESTSKSAGEAASALPERVGSQACRSCHRELHTSYHKTVTMARSFYPMTPANEVENWQSDNTFHHARSSMFYKMERRGDRYYQKRWRLDPDGKPSHEFEREITHVMGSGNNVRTYVSYSEGHKAMQLPVSWYSESGTWAMSPGFDQVEHGDFGRGIDHGCMFCHNAYPQAPEIDATGTHYVGQLPSGIDCERCHGHGGDHVRLAEDDMATLEDIQEAIVNPAKLSPKLAMDVCLQCHLETAVNQALPHSLRRFDRKTFSFQPGEALEDFLLPFDSPEEDEDRFEIAHHGYRLMQSKCFKASDGAMQCTTCHDPHASPAPEEAQQHFNKTCASCHKPDQCSSEHMTSSEQNPAIAKDDCITCHMPERRAIDVVHAVMRDHRIVRRLPERDLVAPMDEVHKDYKGDLKFYFPKTAPKGPEGDLYLGTAYLQGGVHVKRGIDLIENAIKAGAKPAATPYRMVGFAKAKRKDFTGATAAFAKAVELMPDDVTSRAEMAALLLMQGKHDEAKKHFEAVLAKQPDYQDCYVGLSRIASKKADKAGARSLLEQAVNVAPEHVMVRKMLIRQLLAEGNSAAARMHLETVLRVSPKDAAALVQLASVARMERNWAEVSLRTREALALDPSNQNAAFLLASVYATAPDATLRNGPAALDLVQRALRGQTSSNPSIQLIVAAANAECGNYGAAIRIAEATLKLARGNAGLTNLINTRLAAYRKNTPWYEPN